MLLGNGSGGFSAASSFAAGSKPDSVTTADLNGDGTPDLIVADRDGGVSVLLGNGSGGFSAAKTYAAGPMSESVTTADVNGDGKQDLIVADGTFGVFVLLGNGSGAFSAATSYAAGPDAFSVTTADVNGDGKQDLIVADFNGGVSLLLGNGSGGFSAATTYAAGVQPHSVTTADVNGDGTPDVIVADASGGVSVLLNIPIAACYLRGTRIATPAGEVAIETLRIGDAVSVHSGASRPIRWIGRRSYAGRFAARNQAVLPVLIRAGALAGVLGAGLPHRDLMVSPQHAMYFDGVLVPAAALVNGVSIVRLSACDQIDYFHIEFATHDVIFAEGAPSESFLDDNSRGLFENAHEFALLYPDAPAPGGFCARKVEAGPALDAIRRRLDGDSIQEVHLDRTGKHDIALRPGASAIRLTTAYAQAPGDRRRLGAAVTALTLDGAAVPLDDGRLVTGWHACEAGWRWTDGAALVLVAGAQLLEVSLTALACTAIAA